MSRIVPADQLVDEALAVAEVIAKMSKPAAAAVKNAINYAFQTGLDEGLKYERALFKGRFATADQKEGMKAFLEKRDAKFSDS